jgi:SSS family solute:Na+ symporter
MAIGSLDVLAIALYFIFLLFFAYLTRRNRSFSEFAIAKHSVPATLIFASLATTIVGPGFSIGFTSKSWANGYLYYYMVLPYALQVVLVGTFVAPKLAQYRDSRSLGEVMRTKYGKLTQVLSGLISAGLCVGFSAVMGKVGGSTLHDVTGWSLGLCIAVMTAVTALITFSGGLRATIATEALQFSLKAIVVPILVLIAVFSLPADMSSIADKANELTNNAYKQLSTWQIVGICISFMLGEALIPPYTNRALAAKTSDASRDGFIMAGLFCAVWLGMVAFLGIVAHSYLPPSTVGDNVLLEIGRKLLPQGIFGLLLATMIALIMSSQESVLNSAAVSFTSDVLAPLIKLSERMALIVAKSATLVLAALAAYAAQYSPSIIDGLLLLYAIWAPSILVPLVLGLFVQKTRPMAGVLSIVVGGGSSILWQQFAVSPNGPPAILVGLSLALGSYGLGHVAGRPIQQSEFDR